MPNIFRGEPLLWLTVLSAGLSVIVTLNVGLSPEQAALWVAGITAVFGAAKAAMTRPWAPAAFTALVTAVADLLAGYHFALSAGFIGAVNGFVLAVLALLSRAQVTPAAEPMPLSDAA